MADKKITELTNITGANLVDADEFVVVDISADETKAITLGELKEAFDSGSGFVRITGDTMTGDLALSGADVTFGDNDKAIFGGVTSELQIYSDGSNSYVKDVGTGDLYLQGSNNVQIESASGANMIYATAGAQVRLFYNGSPKFNTTSTGIDVTGTVTADGLTVDGTAVINNAGSIGYGGNLVLTLNDTANDYPMLRFTGTSGGLFAIRSEGTNSLKFYEDTGSALKSRMFIAEGGDISFYEDTGTTPKFFWDASAESLGIGTSSPDKLLHLKTSVNNTAVLRIESTAANSYPHLSLKNDAREYQLTAHGPLGDVFTIYDGTAGSHRFVIDSSGNVGIGTSSPAANLEITDSIELPSVSLSSTGTDHMGLITGTVSSMMAATTGNNILFAHQPFADRGTFSNFTERMRIDSSGNVQIGTTTSAGKLTVDGSIVSQNAAQGSGNVQLQGYGATSYINHSGTGSLIFRMGTGYSEKMRIDSSGNLLVGTTSNSVYNDVSGTGIALNAGEIQIAGTGTTIYANRQGSDGDIVQFRKDGSTVGSIGVSNSNVTIGNGGAGIKFTGSINLLEPWTPSSNSASDGAIDIGYSGGRFKDLYLSGGVYLGGTGSANKLDDYEIGTFTPDISFSGVNAETYSRQEGSYVKVGGLVFCSIAIIFQKNTSTGVFGMGGFPFPCNAALGNDRGTASFGYWSGLSNGYYTPLFLMDNAATSGYFRIGGTGTASTNGSTSLSDSTIGSEVNFHLSVVYRTNS